MAVGRYVFGLPHMYRYLSMYVCACSATVWIGQIWMGGGGGGSARPTRDRIFFCSSSQVQWTSNTLCGHACMYVLYLFTHVQFARLPGAGTYVRTSVRPASVRRCGLWLYVDGVE